MRGGAAAHRHGHGDRERGGAVGVERARATFRTGPRGAKVRLVKGSHIVVPKVHSLGHACILQNPDKRVIFVIPFEGKYSLIGTTDVPGGHARGGGRHHAGGDATTSSRRPTASSRSPSRGPTSCGPSPACARSTTTASPTRPPITRDYVLELDDEGGKAPVLSLFGGKITTYRCLAETALAKLAPYLPADGPAWTKEAHLPGGDVRNYNAFRDEMFDRYKGFPRDLLDGVVRRHGSRTTIVLGDIADARGARHELRRRPHRSARSSASSPTSGPRPPTTSCGAAPSAACTWTPRSAPPSRPTSPAASSAPAAAAGPRCRVEAAFAAMAATLGIRHGA